MKALDVALKDLLRSFRSPFALVMTFAAPLLITGLLYFAFGGLSGDDGGFEIARTQVQVVNQDEADAGAGFSAGTRLVAFLQDEAVAEMIDVTVVADEAEARTAVDAQEAGVAVIIPAGLTNALTTPGERASVTLYQDPTLSIGPGIIKDLVAHFLDGFSGAQIAVNVTAHQLSAEGLPVEASVMEEAAVQYAAWLNSGDHHEAESITIQPPPGRAEATDGAASVLAPTMAGMMIFFVFFIGAYGAESIIREDEEGTLERLFTTPTPQGAILGGKFVAVVLALAVQIVVLLASSSLLFDIRWGQPATIVLAALGLIVAAAGFGLMLMSFIKSTRQTGPVMGGVLPVMGMLGGLFTTGIPNLPAAFDTITLVTPHGWALRSWNLALAGAGPTEVLLPALVLVGMGIIFFGVGVGLFRRRFS